MVIRYMLIGHAKETLNCVKKLVNEKKLAYAFIGQRRQGPGEKDTYGKPARVRSPETQIKIM